MDTLTANAKSNQCAMKLTKEQAKQHISDLLEYIGEDPNRTGLQQTPDRVLRMFEEIFRGYDPEQAPKITTFPNGEDGLQCNDMVFDKGDFYSLCEHHVRTFFGTYYFAYIPNPNGKVLGISKIGRVVDYCSSKLQIQERLAQDIVNMLYEALWDDNGNAPLGMAIMLKGRHMCKESRGARKKGEMTSIYLRGKFKHDPQVRAEFMAMCNNS